MSRATINAGRWEPESLPPPVQYAVDVSASAGRHRVSFAALHGARDGRQTCAHAYCMTADEAAALGRALLLAAMEAS